MLGRQLLTISRQVPLQLAGIRNLYSASALGIDSFLNAKSKVENQFTSMQDKFFTKMKDYAFSESKNMIFTEDLKNMAFLIGKDPEHLTLIHQMMKRFNQQNKNLRFGTFIFGPVVMRMYHNLNCPEEALKAFRDPELDGFFDQLASFQVLLDLLYNNNMYSEVLDVFDAIQTKQLSGSKYPKNAFVIVLAALYKMNTPESYEKMVTYMGNCCELGVEVTRRGLTLAAGLALNQNQPQTAIELIARSRNQNYVTVRNIRIAALCDLGRADDALPLLKTVVSVDAPIQKKQTILSDVHEKITAAVAQLGNKDVEVEFKHLESVLRDTEQLSEETLDDLLTSVMEPLYRNERGQDAPFSRFSNQRSFQRRDGYDQNRPFQRRDGYDQNRPFQRRDGYDQNRPFSGGFQRRASLREYE